MAIKWAYRHKGQKVVFFVPRQISAKQSQGGERWGTGHNFSLKVKYSNI